MRRAGLVHPLVASAALAVLTFGGLTGCSTSSGEDAMTPPSPDELVGRWVTGVSYGESGMPPYLLIAADGTWLGSDGCNTTGGSWSLAEDGALDVTAGPSTLIGCEGAALPQFFAESATAAIDGGRLRLFDDEGATVVKLARSTLDEAPSQAADPAGG